MFQIRQEVPTDLGAVAAMLDAGFGPDRRSRTVYRLRQGPPASGLAFIAADPVSDAPLATLRFWEVRLGDRVPAVLLGPLAVQAPLRGQGLGRALVSHGLAVVHECGWPVCLVSGEPDYYAPFGFVDGSALGLAMPGPVRAGWLQARLFDPQALSDLPSGPIQVAAAGGERRRSVRGGRADVLSRPAAGFGSAGA